MQSGADFIVVQQSPEPTGLVRRPKKGVIAVNGRVLPIKYVVDLADRFGGNILHSLNVLRDEQKMVRIDVACLDEPFCFLGAAAWVVLVHETALIVHEAVQISARP